jgi:hypothetical protein
MGRGDRMKRQTWWAAFWYDWRRLNTHMPVVAVVALSFKVHWVYFGHEPDPLLHQATHFWRRMPPPRPLSPPRPMRHTRRPEPRKSHTACLDSLPRASQHPRISQRTRSRAEGDGRIGPEQDSRRLLPSFGSPRTGRAPADRLPGPAVFA